MSQIAIRSYGNPKWLLTVGAILILISLAFFIKTLIFLSHDNLVAEGKVIALEQNVPTGRGGYTYNPTIEFTDGNGTVHIFKSKYGEGKNTYYPTWEIGQTIPVIYDPSRPELAEIKSFRSQWLFAVFPFIMGAIFFVAYFLSPKGVIKTNA